MAVDEPGLVDGPDPAQRPMDVRERPVVDGVEVFDRPAKRRPFSPGDLVRLLVGLILIAVGWLLAELGRSTIAGIERDLVDAVDRLPGGVERPILGGAQLLASLVPITVLVVLLVTRRFRRASLLVLAYVTASIAIEIVDGLLLGDRLAERLVSGDPREDPLAADPAWPGSGIIASTTAAVTVAAPWLTRRWKRALWLAVALLVLLRLVAVALPALDVVIALGVGIVVGSAVLFLFGSPTNEPNPEELISALRTCGIEPRSIDRAESRDSSLRYDVVDRDGRASVVTLRTPDEIDADLLNRFYRGLRYRASEVRSPFATLKRRIEHEVLVLGIANKAGVRTAEVIRIGTTERESVFFVASRLPTSAATADGLQQRGVLDDLWEQIGRLHGVGVAHRRLARESIHLDDDDRIWLRDFDGAETAASERELARDVAQLLTETAIVVGPHDAVAHAVDVLGADRVAPALRMLQPLALPPTTRSRAADRPDLLDELREEVSEATGEPELELEDLERVKPRAVLIVAASSLAFYSLLPQLANLDETAEAFRDSEPVWLIAALAASVSTYVFAAIALQGAVSDPIPFGPTLRAQSASSFASLVGPANIGRFALTGRFLERLGVKRAEAAASVAVNGLAGFGVHVVLMIGFFVWAGNTSLAGFSLPDSQTVLAVVAIAFAVIGVIASIRPVRRKLLAPFWSAARDGVSSIGRVFTSPGRVVELFGGSTGITLSYVAVIVCTVEAFGGGISVAEIGAAYLGAVALATFAPTPGNLGALESAMIAGLTGFGLPAGIAVSATLTFRVATFWLPILPGWLAFGWMQRNGEL